MPRGKSQLSLERVLEGGIALADEVGIESFTIRRLADALGASPMSVYHYVSSKDEIIDGMVDLVFSEIALPPEDVAWKEAITVRCHSARSVLVRHPWAAPLMESRLVPGPANLRHHEAVLACLRRGLPLEMAAHAYAAIDAFVYGFAFQEANLPIVDDPNLAAAMVDQFPADLYPNLFELTKHHVMQPGYAFGDSFDVGLALVLDGLEARA
jgi:AcrR family transcriptional regulator